MLRRCTYAVLLQRGEFCAPRTPLPFVGGREESRCNSLRFSRRWRGSSEVPLSTRFLHSTRRQSEKTAAKSKTDGAASTHRTDYRAVVEDTLGFNVSKVEALAEMYQCETASVPLLTGTGPLEDRLRRDNALRRPPENKAASPPTRRLYGRAARSAGTGNWRSGGATSRQRPPSSYSGQPVQELPHSQQLLYDTFSSVLLLLPEPSSPSSSSGVVASLSQPSHNKEGLPDLLRRLVHLRECVRVAVSRQVFTKGETSATVSSSLPMTSEAERIEALVQRLASFPLELPVPREKWARCSGEERQNLVQSAPLLILSAMAYAAMQCVQAYYNNERRNGEKGMDSGGKEKENNTCQHGDDVLDAVSDFFEPFVMLTSSEMMTCTVEDGAKSRECAGRGSLPCSSWRAMLLFSLTQSLGVLTTLTHHAGRLQSTIAHMDDLRGKLADEFVSFSLPSVPTVHHPQRRSSEADRERGATMSEPFGVLQNVHSAIDGYQRALGKDKVTPPRTAASSVLSPSAASETSRSNAERRFALVLSMLSWLSRTLSAALDSAAAATTITPAEGETLAAAIHQHELLMGRLHAPFDRSVSASARSNRTNDATLNYSLWRLWEAHTVAEGKGAALAVSTSQKAAGAVQWRMGDVLGGVPVYWLHNPAHACAAAQHLQRLVHSMQQAVCATGGAHEANLSNGSGRPTTAHCKLLHMDPTVHSSFARTGLMLELDLTTACQLALEEGEVLAPLDAQELVQATRLMLAGEERAQRTRSNPAVSVSAVTKRLPRTSEGDGSRRRGLVSHDVVRVCGESCRDDRPRWEQLCRACGALRKQLSCLAFTVFDRFDRNEEARLLPGEQHPANSSASSPVNESRPTSVPSTQRYLTSMMMLYGGLARRHVLFLSSALCRSDYAVSEVEVRELQQVLGACLSVFLRLRRGTSGVDSAQRSREAMRTASENLKMTSFTVCGTTLTAAIDVAYLLTLYGACFEDCGSAVSLKDDWNATRSIEKKEEENREKSLSDSGQAFTSYSASSAAAGNTVAVVDITRGEARDYVKDVLFLLGCTTAWQLAHLRQEGRLYSFSGRGQAGALPEEESLRLRHVESTVACVYAYHMMPTFLWMPLQSLQEWGFILSHHVDLLYAGGIRYQKGQRALASKEEGARGGQCSTTDELSEGKDRKLAASSDVEDAFVALSERQSTDESGDGTLAAIPSSSFERAVLRVGNTTVDFSREHGYFMRRLYVLSNVLREYRQLVQERLRREGAKGSRRDRQNAKLLGEALHYLERLEPKEERVRRENRPWAKEMGRLLLHRFPSTAAQVEGTANLLLGATRSVARMEALSEDARNNALSINEKKTRALHRQQRSRSRRPDGLDGTAPTSPTGERAAMERAPTEVDAIAAGRSPVTLDVSRLSPGSALGFVLDGASGCVTRVKRVITPADSSGASEGGDQDENGDDDDADEDERLTPFASAAEAAGFLRAEDVIGWRVCAVDETPVTDGKEVMSLVRGKDSFRLVLRAPHDI